MFLSLAFHGLQTINIIFASVFAQAQSPFWDLSSSCFVPEGVIAFRLFPVKESLGPRSLLCLACKKGEHTLRDTVLPSEHPLLKIPGLFPSQVSAPLREKGARLPLVQTGSPLFVVKPGARPDICF